MSVYEYLMMKGFRKVHQPHRRYNVKIEELVNMLEEFTQYQDMHQTSKSKKKSIGLEV